jgi:hypothetical protein
MMPKDYDNFMTDLEKSILKVMKKYFKTKHIYLSEYSVNASFNTKETKMVFTEIIDEPITIIEPHNKNK